MVYVRDEGMFDAPIEKVWKYVQNQEGDHRHDTIPNMRLLEQKGNVAKVEAEVRGADGNLHKETWKFVYNPPYSYDFEALEGPQKGTRHTHAYIPAGDQTKVIVAGDFHIQGVKDAAQVEKLTLQYLERVFNEDNANLARKR